jgi:hypothetical protein
LAEPVGRVSPIIIVMQIFLLVRRYV